MAELMLNQEVQNCYQQVAMDQVAVAQRQMKWVVVLGARIFPDGDQWCALYGEDLQHGICGFGDTPEGAIEAFEKAMSEPISDPTTGGPDVDRTR